LGWVPLGEDAGQTALDFYVDILNDPNAGALEKGAAWAGGFFAALWTPCTSNQTALTLAGGYAGRVIGTFSPRGLFPKIGRIRQYLRFDPPHHGKGWHLDGSIPNTIRNTIRNWFK